MKAAAFILPILPILSSVFVCCLLSVVRCLLLLFVVCCCCCLLLSLFPVNPVNRVVWLLSLLLLLSSTPGVRSSE